MIYVLCIMYYDTYICMEICIIKYIMFVVLEDYREYFKIICDIIYKCLILNTKYKVYNFFIIII